MEAVEITDWDDAYANAIHIPGGADYPARWTADAAAFRQTARVRDGVFLPEGTPRGLVVFIHGGWWVANDPSMWSQFAAGALVRGWAVAMPGYTLAPAARIAQIGRQVAAGIEAAASVVDGPLVLSGHSAGGQLCARMLAAGTPLAPAVMARVVRSVPISGLFDLRPLMTLAVNAQLQIDEAEAAAEGPQMLRPAHLAPMTVWVGGAERIPFRWQSAAFAATWAGLGVPTRLHEAPGRHHFDVLDPMRDPKGDLTEALVGGL